MMNLDDDKSIVLVPNEDCVLTFDEMESDRFNVRDKAKNGDDTNLSRKQSELCNRKQLLRFENML